MGRLASTLLLATLITGVAAPATATPTVTQAQAPTKDKVVEPVRLGHDPVKVLPATRVRLRFFGEKGELVNLARWSVSDIVESTPHGRRTLRLGGKVVTPLADGYWRLPADGSYAVTWRPTEEAGDAIGKVALQVRKAIRKDVAVGGPTVRFPSRSNKTYLARVRLRDTRIRLRSTGELDHVTRGKGLTIEPIGGHELFLEPGVTIHSDDSRSWHHGLRASSGTYLVAVEAGSTLQLTTAQTTPILLDGPATGPHSSSLHEQLFTFEGVAGQVVYRATTDSIPWDDELIAPDGNLVRKLGLLDGFELPTTGTYTIAARPRDDSDQQTAFTLRLRTATPGPTITAGGSPAQFVPTEPGRWVASRILMPTAPPSGWLLEATNGAASDPTWRAAATAEAETPCPFEATANGCGSQVGATVHSAGLSSRFDLQPAAGATMLVIYDPGAGGSTPPVDLAIRSSY